MKRSLVVLALLTSASLSAQQLSLEAIFGDQGSEQSPSQLSWAPNGHQLAYLWNDGSGRAFWILDAATGQTRRAFHLSALQSVEAELSMDAYHWHPSSQALLIESHGDLFLYGLESHNLRRLTQSEAAESDPKFSPTGDRVAFVRAQDLYLIDIDSAVETRLTEDGVENVRLNGLTDWVYWEELWGRDSTGYWWSPDGSQIAYYQFDETPVRDYALVDFMPQYPAVEWQKYPKAGEDNPRVRVGVLNLDNGQTAWLDTGDPVEWYLPRVDWRPQGDLAVQRLNRGQDHLDVLRCAPADGSCVVWLSETSETWVDVTDDYRYLPDGRLLWPSERSGWNRLYLIEADGTVGRTVARADGSVTSLAGIDLEAGHIYYQAYGAPPLGAISRQLYRADLDGDAIERLSPENGWTSTLMSDKAFRVQSWSDAATPPTRSVRGPNDSIVAQLPYDPPAIDLSSLPRREFFTITDADGRELPASIVLPDSFDEDGAHPVVMYHYGGPESQVIRDAWSGGSRELWTRMMAQRGFVMFSVDNPGSSFFGQRGADAMHRRFGEVNLAAQQAGVEYLRARPGIDGDRIGIWGWSGGGSNTLYSVLRSPGTWKAAVSGAPVTDWRLYDTIWTERYLDHPDENPDGYRDSSAVTWAADLADELLLIHGTADDNVHPQNSLALMQKFIDAGVQFDSAIYPRQKHGFRGPASRHFYERMTGFWDLHLGSAGPAVEHSEGPKG